MTASSFEVRLADWGTAGLHTEVETVSFMVIEEGRHVIGGVIFDAGKKTDVGTLFAGSTGQTGFRYVYFDSIEKLPDADGEYNYAPLTQIVGDADPSAIDVRHYVLTSWSDRLRYRFEQNFYDTSSVTVPELHYVIIQAGAGVTAVGLPFKAFSTVEVYSTAVKNLSYGETFIDPLIFTKTLTTSGSDSANLRISSVGEDQLTMVLQEPAGWNPGHFSEKVSMFVLGSPREDQSVGDLNASHVITNFSRVRYDLQVDGDIELGGGVVLTDSDGGVVSVDTDLFGSLTDAASLLRADGTSFSVGTNNFLSTPESYVIGSSNSSILEDGSGERNIIIGYDNSLGSSQGAAENSIVIGHNNIYDGSNFSWVIGRGNIGQSHTLTVGSYAQTMNEASLIVGTGSSDLDRDAAMVVSTSGLTTLTHDDWDNQGLGAPYALEVNGGTRLNGEVIISEPQGDISMGIFGE
ncbi:MAG: hypothetical protein ACSHX0_03920 [Akkermansiaceae bacterium]